METRMETSLRPRVPGVCLPSLAILLTLVQTLDRPAVRVVKPALREAEIVGDYVLARRFLISQESRVHGLRADKRNRTEEGQSKERSHLNVDPAGPVTFRVSEEACSIPWIFCLSETTIMVPERNFQRGNCKIYRHLRRVAPNRRQSIGRLFRPLQGLCRRSQNRFDLPAIETCRIISSCDSADRRVPPTLGRGFRA